jgi:hypothetical protein
MSLSTSKHVVHSLVYSIGVFFFGLFVLYYLLRKKYFYFLTTWPNLAKFMPKFSMVTKLERKPYLLLSEANISYAPNEVEQIRGELALFFSIWGGDDPLGAWRCWGRRT